MLIVFSYVLFWVLFGFLVYRKFRDESSTLVVIVGPCPLPRRDPPILHHRPIDHRRSAESLGSVGSPVHPATDSALRAAYRRVARPNCRRLHLNDCSRR